MKTGIETLISEVGKRITNKTQVEGGIISGLGINKTNGKEYVIISVCGSSSMTKEQLSGLCGIKVITEKLITETFDSNGIPVFSYCTVDDFFNYWNIINDEEIKSSIDLTFKEAKELFFSTISWDIKEKILRLYSRRQLEGLPEKIEYPKIPQDYPAERFRDSARAFKELIWLVKEYTKASALQEPNWDDYSQDKFAIVRCGTAVMISKEKTFFPIAFLSKEVAQVFLEDHKELLEEYYMIGK